MTYAKEKDGGIAAYDVQLLEICRDQRWVCWSVSPEVFHHGVGESEIQHADSKTDAVGEVKVRTRKREDERVERATWNLDCGARSKGLWVSEEDTEGRKRVKEFVRGMVRSGECPLNAVDGENRLGRM